MNSDAAASPAGFRLHGQPCQRAPWLSRILILCDVVGIHEQDDFCDVWLSAPAALPNGIPHEVLEELSAPPADSWDFRRDDLPIVVAPDLVVRPPWVPSPAGFDGIELVVSRGMAFGSGEHESTQLALRLLQRLLPRDVAFTDVGTGSGILALLAATRGCHPILACDVDHDAARAARELLPTAWVATSGPEALRGAAADWVVANMTATELTACWPALTSHCRERGVLIASGIRHGEWQEFRRLLPGPVMLELRGEQFVAVACSREE